MTELNHNTLQAALARLPLYEPPVSNWEDLDSALEANAVLVDSAQRLRVYEPPAAVWENVTARLPVARPMARRLILWPRYAVAAAMIAVLCSAWWLLHPVNGMTMPEQIVVTQEIMDPQVVETAQESEDDAFQQLQHLCSTGAPVCEQPGFRLLKSELDELTAAKQELHSALGQYGDDPELTAQLVQIELARTQLLQEMMQMI